MFTFQLSNANIGTITSDTPREWQEIETVLKRSKDSDGVVLEVTFNIEFVKNGRAFIQQVYEQEGVEGIIDVAIFEYNPNEFRDELFTSGRINLADFDIGDTDVKVNIEQTGFIQNFKNLNEVKVDLKSLENYLGQSITPGTSEISNIEFHSKSIIRAYEAKAEGTTNIGIRTLSQAFFTIGFNDIAANEIDQVFSLGTGILESIVPNFLTVEEKGSYDLSFRLKGNVNIITSSNFDFQIFYGINNPSEYPDDSFTFVSPPGLIPIGPIYNGGPSQTLVPFDNSLPVTTLNLSQGDKVYLFIAVKLTGVSSSASWGITFDPETFIDISANTIFDPTTADVKLIHEAFERTAQYITGKQTPFRSEFFGRTDLGYGVDGDGALSVVTNGDNIRQKQSGIYVTWKDLFQSENAKYHLGYGYETFNDMPVVRVEKKRYFYDKDVSVDLGCIRDIRKSVAQDRIYNQIDGGYSFKFNDKINALDEFNTDREYTLPITQVKNKLNAKSPYDSSGYNIEFQRRLITEPTKDGRHDDSNFVIRVVRVPSGYETERNQGMTLTNVIDPESVYNARISPARNIRNWGPTIKGSMLKQLGRLVKFSFGKANFDMTSQIGSGPTVNEGADIDPNEFDDPFWIPEIYAFTANINRDQFRAMANNPYKMVKFSTEDGNDGYGWIEEISLNKRQNIAEVKLLRVYNPV